MINELIQQTLTALLTAAALAIAGYVLRQLPRMFAWGRDYLAAHTDAATEAVITALVQSVALAVDAEWVRAAAAGLAYDAGVVALKMLAVRLKAYGIELNATEMADRIRAELQRLLLAAPAAAGSGGGPGGSGRVWI